MDSIERCIVERARHEQEIQNRLKRLNERKLQILECKVQKVKATDASSGDTNCSGLSRNECNDKSTSGDDTNIRPSYDTEPMAEVDSNTTLDSSDMCDHDNQADHERVTLANLITNLKLVIDENKKNQKQLKKANASLTQELKECKSTLEETNQTLRESNSTQDSCLIALQNKQTELEKYKTYLNRTTEYGTLECKLKDTLGLLAQNENDIKGALKGLIYNGRPTFANLMYLKKAQSEKPCLYKILYETSDLANRFTPDRKETLTLEQESVSKLNKYLEKPYDYTKQNSLCEVFKPPTHKELDQLWNRPKHVSFQTSRESVGSNDMVHNYYLEEAKNKAQLQIDKALNSKPSVQQSAKLSNTANGQKFSPNKSYAVYLKTTPPKSGLTWKPTGRIFTQEILLKLNLPDHRFRRRCSNLILVESDSLPHAQTQPVKTYHKHPDSRIKKAKVHTRERLSQTLIFKIFLIDIKNFKTKMSREIVSKLSR
ncbi:hypothetical protein Tco_0377256 [Tanacetum coccineum]